MMYSMTSQSKRLTREKYLKCLTIGSLLNATHKIVVDVQPAFYLMKKKLGQIMNMVIAYGVV